MKLICKNDLGYFLTPGKSYEVTPINLPDVEEFIPYYFDYLVVNDIGTSHYVEKTAFISIDEQRNILINKLGIE